MKFALQFTSFVRGVGPPYKGRSMEGGEVGRRGREGRGGRIWAPIFWDKFTPMVNVGDVEELNFFNYNDATFLANSFILEYVVR
jgi:hypothetical protein